MTRQFDAEYWEKLYQESPAPEVAAPSGDGGPNPHLAREVSGLTPGRALDAGCGQGIETAWLAQQGWQVTGVDISRTALARAARILQARGVGPRVELIAADLTAWAPEERYDLVTTHYAHPTIPQLEFYRRVAGWVAVGGTLLIIGHLHRDEDAGHHHASHPGDLPASGHPDHSGPHHLPEEAEVRAADVVALLDEGSWRVETAVESSREVPRGESTLLLHDVIVRATRIS
ncbi:class I SAM-dependent methyltransferase [Nesterenkonia xinjiangensis]|uniref:SAM-dependent methyltransferase n=1 Tax=Nesterenkonia xinjiangensis TaxID=225327 RepID=A0A7Z0GM94_9MICC|nr:class I SAM-dependent methyltransferase [Nesterenkonia xinjiangensis]NYJ78353.1 SAM-dependent methyltransferase [Nesterenkonia xinjiangensis]